MNSIYFHEDSHCMIELIPESALPECKAEMDQISEFSKAHWDGTGWTDIYVREDQTGFMESLQIGKLQLESVLEPFLTRYDTVYTGYSTYREECPDMTGWGDGTESVLFAQYNKERVVNALWFSEGCFPVQDPKRWLSVIEALNALYPFHLADWYWDVRIECRNKEVLRSYLIGEFHLDEMSSE